MKKLIYDEVLHANENLNTIESKYFETRNKLLEAELELELKKVELINACILKEENDRQQEAQLIQYLKEEYVHYKKLSMELNTIKAQYNSAKRTFNMWQQMMESQR